MNKINELIENFEFLEDWEDKYSYIIELGETLSVFPEKEKIDVRLVEGCTSRVWFIAEKKDGRVFLKGDSDSKIVKGLIAILFTLYNGKTKEEILTADPENLFNKLGLKDHLSPSRSNGFFAMVKRIKEFTLD